jgi:hypothetical protein
MTPTPALILAALLGTTAAEPARVAIKVDGNQINFFHGSMHSARYIFGPDLAKPFFWPVVSPDGTPLTRGWPMQAAASGEATDHVHQKSLWFCHGDVIPEGMELKTRVKGVTGVDFWSETPGHGKIVCTKVGEPQVKGSHGQVRTVNEWRTADDEKILDEVRDLHFYDLGSAQLIVFAIDLHASVCPITFGDTKEGSLGVRVRQELTASKGKGQLTNADGKVGELFCWGQKSAWCDDSGLVGNTTVGIAILAHPDNPCATCWHSRGYGLMAANPFGRDKAGFPAVRGNKELVKLAQGEHLRLRYGVLLHQGNAGDGKVAEIYKTFTASK